MRTRRTIQKNYEATQDQGIKFVLSLLLIIGSFLYAVYLFFENNAIDINLYYLFKYLISLLIILIILHVIYLFLEGISIKIQYNEKLNNLSKFIYLLSFSFLLILIAFMFFYYITCEIDIDYNIYLFALALFSFSVGFIILKYFMKEFLNGIEAFSEIISLMNKPLLFLITFILLLYYYIIKSLVSILIPITILIIYICYNIAIKRWDFETFLIDLKKSLYICVIIAVICAFLLAPFSLFIFSYSLSSYIMGGHFTNNMESVYSKKDIQIPITIQVTGVNDDLSVYLVKENSTHNFNHIDNITLESKHNFTNTKATSKKVLVGNSLGYGTYNIFINTSTITPGYYELIYTISEVDGKYDVKGFYLLDDNFSS